MAIGESETVDRPVNQEISFVTQFFLYHNKIERRTHYSSAYATLPQHPQEIPDL